MYSGTLVVSALQMAPEAAGNSDHRNSLKKSSHILPTPSDSSPKTLQADLPNDLAFYEKTAIQHGFAWGGAIEIKMLRTQLAFRYSLSIFLTSGNRAANGGHISVTTFSGVREHLMCSNADAFGSTMPSPGGNVKSMDDREEKLTMATLVHALHVGVGHTIVHGAMPRPDDGRRGFHVPFPGRGGERSEVQAWSWSQVYALTQVEVGGHG